ncbi:hypothetical protein DFR50_11561 [Roseiarcus fermentans]|uniref:Uncharacterized protein n=1 Tax=Roseiarcus fermentans TaxID=1473586 RepID=A0A366FBA0_9HYPH|nr:hypothetical protein [Roseiarcus fermentans]RBP11954.1 hypothetical protein DFR50_11561 [Roseiarcus fermentans]
MADWKVFYRDQLDTDRTVGGAPSMEAALERAKDLYCQQRAAIYRIEGPNGRSLSKQEVLNWVHDHRH